MKQQYTQNLKQEDAWYVQEKNKEASVFGVERQRGEW